MSDVLEQALAFTLGNEGGYTNNPADRGGATNFGIIQRELDEWRENHPDDGTPADVKDLTMEQAKTIYRTNYWRWDGIADAPLAIKLFDIGVNCGPGTAAKILQAAVNTLIPEPVAVDGHIGPATLAAVNAQPVDVMMGAVVRAQSDHYHQIVDKNPSQSVFLKGWLNRAMRVPEAV